MIIKGKSKDSKKVTEMKYKNNNEPEKGIDMEED